MIGDHHFDDDEARNFLGDYDSDDDEVLAIKAASDFGTSSGKILLYESGKDSRFLVRISGRLLAGQEKNGEEWSKF